MAAGESPNREDKRWTRSKGDTVRREKMQVREKVGLCFSNDLWLRRAEKYQNGSSKSRFNPYQSFLENKVMENFPKSWNRRGPRMDPPNHASNIKPYIFNMSILGKHIATLVLVSVFAPRHIREPYAASLPKHFFIAIS